MFSFLGKAKVIFKKKNEYLMVLNGHHTVPCVQRSKGQFFVFVLYIVCYFVERACVRACGGVGWRSSS